MKKNLLGDSFGDSIRDSLRGSLMCLFPDSIRDSLWDSLRISHWKSIEKYIRNIRDELSSLRSEI